MPALWCVGHVVQGELAFCVPGFGGTHGAGASGAVRWHPGDGTYQRASSGAALPILCSGSTDPCSRDRGPLPIPKDPEDRKGTVVFCCLAVCVLGSPRGG